MSRKFRILLVVVAVSLLSCAPRVQKSLAPPREAALHKPLHNVYSLQKPVHLSVEVGDTDGDGVLDRYTFRSQPAGAVTRVVTQEEVAKTRCKRFVLCMDSVPYGTMKQLWDQGYFREFHPPSAMISPFPSMTFLSFTEIFRTAKPVSYEERYFDRKNNKLAGGMMEHLHKDRMAEFYNLFDYQTPGAQGGTIYLAPKPVSAEDFNGMKDSFKLLDIKDEVIAYIGATDGLAHKLGEPGLAAFLKDVDLALRELILTRSGPIKVVVFSDHGNNFVPSRRIPLDDFFKKHFGISELDKRLGLQGRPSVVLPAFGLVNFAVLYTEDGREEELSDFLTTITGVDLVLFSRDGAAVVRGPKGRARILKKSSGEFYKYEQQQGDPLELGAVAGGLGKAGKLDAEGYGADTDWHEATKEHKYVDAIHRLYEASLNLVQNKANLVISIADGYYYGAKWFELFCKVKGTHGSLKRESTLGFAMSNYRRLPPYLRSSEMHDVLELNTKIDSAPVTQSR